MIVNVFVVMLFSSGVMDVVSMMGMIGVMGVIDMICIIGMKDLIGVIGEMFGVVGVLLEDLVVV